MNTKSSDRTKGLATISLILGIISLGLALSSFLPILWARQGGSFGMVIALGSLALVSMLGGLIIGTPGLILGVIALVRGRKQRDQSIILRLATVGIILNGLGMATIFIFIVIPRLLTPG